MRSVPLAVLLMSAVLASACAFVPAHRAFCAAASKWRDAAERLEVTTNSVDRKSADGNKSMNDAFQKMAQITIPATSAGTSEAEFGARIETTTGAAERWLSQGTKFFVLTADGSTASVAQRADAYDSYEKARLEWNSDMRQLNSYASVCDLKPITIYGTGG